jgi:carboxymethylenebutenolidase
MAAKWDAIDVEGQGLAAYVALPESPGLHPGVVVIQHAAGVDEVIKDTVRRLADAGFAAVAPDMFAHQDVNVATPHQERLRRIQDSIVIEDVRGAIAYLRQRAGDQGIGIMGFCLGGRVAYLMAAANPELRAAVNFYGGNFMQPWQEGPSPLDRTAEISCPVLGLFGLDDDNPSPADVQKLDAEMTRLGKPHEFHSYEGVKHTFMSFDSARYNEAVASDAWDKTISWFRKHLVVAKVAA